MSATPYEVGRLVDLAYERGRQDVLREALAADHENAAYFRSLCDVLSVARRRDGYWEKEYVRDVERLVEIIDGMRQQYYALQCVLDDALKDAGKIPQDAIPAEQRGPESWH